MTILVIGAKGFIGSYVASYFKQQGNTVIGCDIVNDFQDEQYIQIDATNADYHSVFEKNNIDSCINCSGAASVPLSLQFPLKDYTLNTVNVFKLLDAIRLYRPACKFINLSSAAIYGNPISLPIYEHFDYAPVSPYGMHKVQAEQICKEFYDYYKIATCSIRIFSAYGEGLKKQLIWDLCKKISSSTSNVKMMGTGNESRDFIHVQDIVQIIALVMNKAPFEADVYNAANGEEVTIKTIVNTFCTLANWQGQIEFDNQVRSGDPINWCANIDKIKALGYTTTVPIEIGLKRVIEWQKENE